MPTSTIIENIRVNNPYALEEYVKFLEQRKKNPEQISSNSLLSGVITDPDGIRALVDKILKKQAADQ